IVISHIRQANVGQIRLANTHPFSREMWGKPWCYAHNGQLSGWQNLPLSTFTPIGTTDSEHAFCWLLGELHSAFPTLPEERAPLWETLHLCCERLRSLGVFNLLLSDGDYLYTYCSTKLTHITRRAPFGQAQLTDTELTVDFSEHTTSNDVVSVIATEPLTGNEQWTAMVPGELLVWHEGEIRARLVPQG
ncbi:MAG TPA: class II glutamine amidotransferase, partial [Porticoccaceae bacterium]